MPNNNVAAIPMSHTEDDTLDVLINQIECIKLLSQAANIKDFKKRILTVLETFGFSDFAVLNVAGPLTGFTLYTLPDELIEAYVNARYQRYDLAVDYIATGETEPFFQSEFQKVVQSSSLETRIFKKNKEIFALFKKHDIHDVIYLPSDTAKIEDEEYQERETVLFVSKGMQKKDFQTAVKRCLPLLEILASAIVYLGKKQFLPAPSQPPIKAKSLKLLAMMAKNNVSVKQAADRLFISLDTANKHMAAAKQAFGTRSQVNAVYIAIKKGLISLED